MKTYEQLKADNPELHKVAREGGTETPFSSEYLHLSDDGIFHCAICGAPLFSTDQKFDSGTGWPSFTDPVSKDAVTIHEDNSHGMQRTEVRCANCGAHLGHVFPDGPKQADGSHDRYCINGVCLDLQKSIMETKKAVLAGGCFWGLEDLLRQQPGVIDTESGYTGGTNYNPTYENHPGHVEGVEITYDPTKTSYKQLLNFFFQIHNPTTLNQQGNDKGTSYRSAIFYGNEEEKKIAEEMIDIVNESGRWHDPVVTTLEPLTRFWPAEEYHQDYLQKNPGGYTCHAIYFDSYLDDQN